LDAWTNATIASLEQSQRAALRAAIREEAMAAKKSLQAAFAAAIKQCTDQRLTLDKWNAAGRPAYRRVNRPALVLPARADGAEQEGSSSGQLQTRSAGWATTYLDDRGDPLFTDHRIVIVVHRIDRVAAIDEALRLGAARWGSVSVRGSDAFLQLAAARAAALNIALVGPNGAEPPAARSSPVPERSSQSKAPTKQAESALADDEKIDRAIRFFANHPALPLRRRKTPGYTRESGRAGLLEVVLKSPNGAGKDALFSADDRLQTFLEERRTETLAQIRALALDPGIERSPTNAAEILGTLKGDEPLLRAATMMMGDQDFQEMLREVRRKALERAPMRDREVEPMGAPDVSLTADVTNAGPDGETGHSVAEMQTFLQGRKERSGR
jgi:hypothetical protein